jgi:hypothetical protein
MAAGLNDSTMKRVVTAAQPQGDGTGNSAVTPALVRIGDTPKVLAALLEIDHHMRPFITVAA